MRQAAAMSNLDVWYTHIEIGRALEQLRTQVNSKQARTTENLPT
jgi:hypothetical protein